MVHRDPLRLIAQRAGTQSIGEQVVIPVPLTAIVQRHHEQVRPLQRLEHLPSVSTAGHRVAQWTREPVQYRRLRQEVADVTRLTLQYLLDQVVDDVAVVAREPRDEPTDV